MPAAHSHPKKIPDEAILSRLVAGMSQQDTAKDLGCTERTVTLRLREPAFKRKLRSARAELVRQSADGFLAKVGQALASLAEIVADTTAPHAARVAAARAILEGRTRTRAEQREQDTPARPPKNVAMATAAVEAAIFARALSGDTRAALAYLAAKDPDTWGKAAQLGDNGEELDGQWVRIKAALTARLESSPGPAGTPSDGTAPAIAPPAPAPERPPETDR